MVDKNVRCKKCRLLLFSTQDYPALNAHGEEIGGNSKESSQDPECLSCPSLTDRSLIFLYEEPLPDFLNDSLSKGAWVKGKINCPKCQSRLGSFNFVVGSHCGCRKSQVPPVHLQTSKVDYIQPNEVKVVVVSHPDQPLSQMGASDLPSACAEVPSTDMQFDDLEQLHRSEEAYEASSHSESSSSASPDVNKEPDSSPHPNASKSKKPKSPSCSPGHQKELQSLTPDPQLRHRKGRARKASHSHSQCCLACHPTNSCDADAPVLHHECSGDAIVTRTRYDVLESEDFSETESESSSQPDEAIPDELLCPVCLDLLYSPMVTRPCGHIFCDPCLRRLGKPTPNNTSCPLCRKLIGICQSCPEVSNEAKERFPDRHNSRWVFEKDHSTQHLPLPYTRHYRVLGLQGDDLGRHHYGAHWHGWRTLAWILTLDALGLALVVLIKWVFGRSSDLDSFQQRQKPNAATASQGALDLESSYPDPFFNDSTSEDSSTTDLLLE